MPPIRSPGIGEWVARPSLPAVLGRLNVPVSTVQNTARLRDLPAVPEGYDRMADSPEPINFPTRGQPPDPLAARGQPPHPLAPIPPNLRIDYSRGRLDEADVLADPIDQFAR